MRSVKDIVLKVIPHKIANDFIKKYHYSGRVVNNSVLHFGCFLDNCLHGVMSYGSPMDKRKVLPLVVTKDGSSVLWNEMIELNRMAFDECLPRNSESRCIAVSIRLIKKNAPHIRWILSYSDGTQCGDGTIYRASGFSLTGIKENKQILVFPDGEIYSQLSISNNNGSENSGNAIRNMLCKKYGIPYYSASTVAPFLKIGAQYMRGYQLRYIYVIDRNCKIAVPVIPFSEIDKIGAGMYKGESIHKKGR